VSRTVQEKNAYLGVDGVTDTKRGHHDIPHDLTILVLLHASRWLTGSSSFSSKAKGISDRQLREMNILLRRVDCLSTEVAVHLLWRDT
jgi:hypothetical protein